MSNASSDHLSFICPKCQKRLRAAPSLAGKKLVCPKCKAPIRVPGIVDVAKDENEWLDLDQAESTTENAGDEMKLGARSQLGRSVFDDDLPDLMPLQDQPALSQPVPPIPSGPKAVPDKPTRPRTSDTKRSKPQVDLDLPDIPLAALKDPVSPSHVAKKSSTSSGKDAKRSPMLVGSLDEIMLESEALVGALALPADDEVFSFPCKVCGSLLNTRHSLIGTNTRCPDCYSQFSVPSPNKKRQQPQLKIDAEVARVTFAPIDSQSIHSPTSDSAKTKELLDRASETVDRERDEFDSYSGSFDTKRWMGFLFGFLRDRAVILAIVLLGLVTGVWFFSMAMFGTFIEMEKTPALLLRIVLFCVFCVPVFGAICMCGIGILTMAANRAATVRDWPFGRMGDAMGESAMVLSALLMASIPGGMIAAVMTSMNAHPTVSLAFMLLGVWGLMPILLLSMIDNGSLFQPYSRAVFSSIVTQGEAWGAMYMQTAAAMLFFLIANAFATISSPYGDFAFGLIVPCFCFFLFNQYGVLAGRLSGITSLGFEGDFSED